MNLLRMTCHWALCLGALTGGLGVVQDFGEGGDVRGVEADDAEAEDGFSAGAAGE